MDNTISAGASGAEFVPLISVALPVYNGEQHLAESIESILGQTFSNFEFIIINDGSTDGSLEILRKYEQAHSCIRLVSRENRNVAATLNEIAQMARGEWIARIDQDDIALPDRFEKQLQWLAHTGADICGSWIRTFGVGSELVISHAQSDAAVKMEMLFCSPLAHPSVMMRRSVLSQLQYNEVGWQAEDYDLWVRAAEAGWKMTNVPEVLLCYRQHANQISTKSNRAQQSLPS